MASAATALPLLTGPQDPSQIDALLNALIIAVNPVITGVTPAAQPVTAGTTSANLPNYGLVTLASTVASAAYVLGRPVPGVPVELVSITTKSQTVTILGGGTFNKSNTKLTFKTTNGAAGAEVWQAASLIGLTTSVYAITGLSGTVKST